MIVDIFQVDIAIQDKNVVFVYPSITNLTQIFDLSGFVSLTKTIFLSGQWCQ